MPSRSKPQHNLMAMVANDPAASKRLKIPQSVGQDFMKADRGRKFAGGGEMVPTEKFRKPKPFRASPPTELPIKTDQEDLSPMPEQTRRMREAAKPVKFAKGGGVKKKPEPYRIGPDVPPTPRPEPPVSPEMEARTQERLDDERKLKEWGNAYNNAARRSMELGFAKGGRIDGCAQRGKTKGAYK